MPVISVAHKSNHLHRSFVLHLLRQHWQDAGHKVILRRNFDPTADICLLHLDQTRIDPARIPAAPEGTPILNGRILDISKRSFSTLLLTPDSHWDGPVIIKTDLNHFGRPERAGKPRGWRAWAGATAAAISWRHAGRLPEQTYPVVKHLRKVPGWVWRDHRLIVEKFLPEREGDLYCLRGWMFLGTKGYGWRLFSKDPMVKVGSMVKYEYIDEQPAFLQQFRVDKGYDFGKFDYVMHDGVPILLDANKTPGFSGDPKSPRIADMATGLLDYLK
jgi:hypothetical protein